MCRCNVQLNDLVCVTCVLWAPSCGTTGTGYKSYPNVAILSLNSTMYDDTHRGWRTVLEIKTFEKTHVNSTGTCRRPHICPSFTYTAAGKWEKDVPYWWISGQFALWTVESYSPPAMQCQASSLTRIIEPYFMTYNARYRPSQSADWTRAIEILVLQSIS